VLGYPKKRTLPQRSYAKVCYNTHPIVIVRSMIDTTFLKKCIATLEKAYTALQTRTPEDGLYDIYRAACVKEFELILEQSGKLLKKRLHV